MNFDVAEPLRIHNQAKPDECTSCALAAIAEDVLKLPVEPSYIYNNSSDGQFGIIPEQAVKAVINRGVLMEGVTTPVYPFVGWKNPLPWVFRFDSIIRLMKKNNRSIFCGLYWQPEWDTASDGIMTAETQDLKWFPHAVKIFGVTTINGIMYLKVQNSVGTDKGDLGIWYMPREVASKLTFAYQLL